MYVITKEAFGKFTKVSIENKKTGEYFSVIPEHGANLIALGLKFDREVVECISGYETYEEIVEHSKSRSAILCPFPNRVANGTYIFDSNGQGEKEYSLPLNKANEGNAIHGFLYDKQFELVDAKGGEEFGSITFVYNYDGSLSGYPFPFMLSVMYQLSSEGLEVKFEVENTGDSRMPIGLGWHPYFGMGDNIGNAELKIPECDEILVDQMIPNGATRGYDKFSNTVRIDREKFDTGFKLGEDRKVSLNMGPGNLNVLFNGQYLQVYIPPDRQSIAIEPMTCAADAFNNKMGLKVLLPGEKMSLEGKIWV